MVASSMGKVLVVVFLFCLCKLGDSLLCYTCSFGEQDTDTSCMDDPAHSATKTNCNKKYCTIMRQEFKDPQGKVASMMRNCEDKPVHMNEIVEDDTYRYYYVACQERLCNGGSGKAGGGDDGSSSLGDKSTLIVPGTGSGNVSKISLFLILSFLFVLRWI